MLFRLIAKRWKRYWALPRARRALLVEAALWLVAARTALLLLPFRTIAAQLGTVTRSADTPTGQHVGSAEREAQAREIAWAVTRAAQHVPFRAVCLPQAITGKIMLRRRGITSALYLGVANEPDKRFSAHAWLNAAGVGVTGYPVAKYYTQIACFV